ncbi:MAG: glycosyltransferase [Gemmatimonadota bacterium]
MLFPCRDAAAYLPQAIRSLQAQTFADFEVVAVDDGSADGSGELLERWARMDGRVRLLRLGRSGLTEALRAGAELCHGEYLARFDADDVAHPLRFGRQLQFMRGRPDIAASGTHIRYFPAEVVGWGARRYERWLNGLSEPEQLARDIFVECPIAHPTLMLRRSVFEEVGGYQSESWPEDYDLILRLHAAGARLANVPQVLHFWRERSDRASRTELRYSADAFRRCKVQYLRATDLRGRGRGRGRGRRDSVAVWGAGRVGKDFARALSDVGVTVRAFYDIDPDKIGQRIDDIPVRDARRLDGRGGGDPYILVAVGASGARELIRGQLTAAGRREPEDYRCVA